MFFINLLFVNLQNKTKYTFLQTNYTHYL